MALSFALKRRDPLMHRYSRLVEITLDNSYPTGGWAITAAQLGFGSSAVIEGVFLESSIKDGYQLQWDHANSKLKVFQGDNTNAAAAPGIELANASAAMNTKVVRILAVAIGQQT